jgi:hypothetical protein
MPEIPPLPRLGRLNSITGCRRELALIYAQARAGQIGWEDASLAADVLRLIVSLLVTGEGAENNPMRTRAGGGN